MCSMVNLRDYRPAQEEVVEGVPLPMKGNPVWEGCPREWLPNGRWETGGQHIGGKTHKQTPHASSSKPLQVGCISKHQEQ